MTDLCLILVDSCAFDSSRTSSGYSHTDAPFGGVVPHSGENRYHKKIYNVNRTFDLSVQASSYLHVHHTQQTVLYFHQS